MKWLKNKIGKDSLWIIAIYPVLVFLMTLLPSYLIVGGGFIVLLIPLMSALIVFIVGTVSSILINEFLNNKGV